jgi:hypothetical protein
MLSKRIANPTVKIGKFNLNTPNNPRASKALMRGSLHHTIDNAGDLGRNSAVQLMVFSREWDPLAVFAPLGKRLGILVSQRSPSPEIGLKQNRGALDPLGHPRPIDPL